MSVSAQCLRNFQTFCLDQEHFFFLSRSLSFHLNLCCQFQPMVIMTFFFFDLIDFPLPNIWFALFLFGIVFRSSRWILCTFTSIASIMCGWMLFYCWQWDLHNGCHPLDDLICYNPTQWRYCTKVLCCFIETVALFKSKQIMICNLWVVSSHRTDQLSFPLIYSIDLGAFNSAHLSFSGIKSLSFQSILASQ